MLNRVVASRGQHYGRTAQGQIIAANEATGKARWRGTRTLNPCAVITDDATLQHHLSARARMSVCANAIRHTVQNGDVTDDLLCILVETRIERIVAAALAVRFFIGSVIRSAPLEGPNCFIDETVFHILECLCFPRSLASPLWLLLRCMFVSFFGGLAV